MSVSWQPVIWVDIIGSAAVLIIAIWCAWLAWHWAKGKKSDTFRHYVFLLTAAIVLFAVSRSVGHLLKNLCNFIGHGAIWKAVSPFSGAVNTTTFIIIFAFGLYFHRQHAIHEQLEEYQNNLEELVEKRTEELQDALAKVKTLSGFLPICSSCKKIRDDKGYWNQIELYIRDHSEAEFTHGICPECKERLYGHLLDDEKNNKNSD